MKKSGFSLVEVLVALGILGVILPIAIGMGIRGLGMSRKSSDKTEALFYAQEGLEAARSMASQYWNSLAAGNHGLNTSGSWQFTGSSDSRGKYNRVINVSPLYRDGSGNLVESAGTLDSDAVKVTSNVSWTLGGSSSLIVSSYLTNFRKLIWLAQDAVLVYSGTLTQPYWRSYDDASVLLGVQQNTITGSTPRAFASAMAPNQGEMIVAYVTTTGVMQVMCFDGETWTNEWSTNVGGNSLTRRFDVAYETNTGDAVVVYSKNVATTNELGYRTKAGTTGCGSSNWSADTSLNPLRTTGIIRWIKMVSDRRASSNLISLAWEDANSDLSVMMWSGTLWGNEPTAVTEANLDYVSGPGDMGSFDLEYESLSGDLMLVWGRLARSNNTNGVRYRVCTNGTSLCNWGAVTTPPTWRDDATSLDIAANPVSDEIVFGSIGMQQRDLQMGYWNGSAWSNGANSDTSASIPIVGSKQVAVGWVRSVSASRSVISYTDSGSTSLNWVLGNGSTFAAQSDFVPSPVFGATQSWLDFSTLNTSLDRTYLLVVDSNSRMHLKRLVWNGSTFVWSNVSSGDGLPGLVNQTVTYPAVFNFWKSKS